MTKKWPLFRLVFGLLTLIAGCTDPTAAQSDEPAIFSDKLICYLTRNERFTDPALLVPVGDGKWIGWVYGTAYFQEPIVLEQIKKEAGPFGAITLIGSAFSTRFSLTIDGLYHSVDGYREDREGQKVTLGGECQILSESNYSLAITLGKDPGETKILVPGRTPE